ncbi:Pseudouridine synthase family protein [Perilla frutescens var. hirtella]|uniref:tRNA pseudouridine(55) synthase n=1 Tax=Perilla frutescens var. hirtella TaxID=608512 RepID=A0AAD4P944_PERFH|nr:Pseudouridine synthase family protein [Perilla frutescens var. hirtella]
MTMATSLHLNLLHHLRRCKPLYTSRAPPLRLFSPRTKPIQLPSTRLLSTATPYPLQYEMIISRPATSPNRRPSRRRSPSAVAANPQPDAEMGFDEWVDKKLSSKETDNTDTELVMDKSQRKYYNKRRKRMYGESESDGENGRRDESDFIELKQEVVELRTLHKREEELYFHDAFAYPWEKNKHYKMVYQLEKKYFPDQCFDKAFMEAGNANAKQGKREMGSEKVEGKSEDDRGLVFFDEREGEDKDVKVGDVSEKKVEDFFKCLKKVPNENGGGGVAAAEPFLSTRSVRLPPKWDGPNGTVVLVNKPKGWTSFTVCGKLRRLVNVKKVGHAGTLDPMATGLLIVCVGKATKVVDRYQGMIKGYSGIFRLGEATSTWDADSPIIQRESWEHIKDDDIKKAAASFCGEIWQVPPMFSAIKVGGERMYEKARKGESIELSPRRISIFQFDVERSLEDRQNVIFRVTCSKGTYIRSLCADFGKTLGSCAHLTALRRDSIGEYLADDAWEFSELEEEITKGYI